MNEAVATAWLLLALAVVLEAAGLDVSRTLVRGWVWIYTALVPAERRDRRREEMAEHLATERAAPAFAGRAAPGTHAPAAINLARGLRTVWRLVRGAPRDVAWAVPLVILRLASIGHGSRARPPDAPRAGGPGR